MLHILSAVVRTLPATQDSVARRIAACDGADVVAVDRGRIIVVLEADDQCNLADMLNRIAGMDGVLSATMVFEHSEPDGAAA
jgi:nitrate reductase NapD